MSGEKTNDFNGIHIAGAVPPGPLHPSVSADAAAVRELVPALTKAVNRLCAILEAIATHGGKLTIGPSAPATRPAAGAPAGSRVKLGGRRGVVRSSGIAGMAIQWDDGAYDVLTSSMTRGIVLE